MSTVTSCGPMSHMEQRGKLVSYNFFFFNIPPVSHFVKSVLIPKAV